MQTQCALNVGQHCDINNVDDLTRYKRYELVMMSIRCRSTYKGDDVDDVNKKEGAQSSHNVDLMLLKIIMPTLNRINKYNAKRY